MAHAIALTLFAHSAQAALPGWLQHSAQTPVPPAQAGSGRPSGGLPGTGITPQRPVVDDTLRQSLNNMGDTLASIAAAQARQAAARRAAFDAPPQIPDGLADGGLKIDSSLPFDQAWRHAEAPEQRLEDGRVIVDITQTADKAVLNWETFNVGRDTTVAFEQDASWALLNRVNDPNARPSQIAGQITGDGTVMILNRNGVLFTGSSQVNVRNLAVSAVNLSDEQFAQGLYGEAQGSSAVPTFANDLSVTANGFSHSAATGDVIVEAGARLGTHPPGSVTEGGGYVLLLGREVLNAGEIVTHNGQTVLAAGDAFVIRKGMGTDENQTATTRGNVVTALRLPGGLDSQGAPLPNPAGRVINSGTVQAATGDITLTGHHVQQQGVLLSSTSVHTRGTVHLTATGSDAQVTLAEDSTTAILLDESATTALDVQREALVRESDKEGDGVHHRRDQSLVQIRSDGDVTFARDSLTLATGGQILVDATGTSEVRDGARLDVAGHVGVHIAMEANNVQINVQGNEQRDAPVNRDGDNLRNSNIWLDRRDLILVPAGTHGYESDRWYTAGGLLEVGGYLGIAGHGIGEWSAQGGTVQFSGGDVVTQHGSGINLSGGTLDVQTGYVHQTWLKGVDGQLYNASSAPGDLLYTGIYQGFERVSERWGQTETWYNPLVAPRQRLENGYVVGRDAGQLVIATRAATLDGDIDTATFQGDRQIKAREQGLDGYHQAQTAIARRGELIIGSWTPVYDTDTQTLRHTPGAVVEQIVLGAPAVGAAPAPATDRITLGADWLNSLELGALRAYATGSVEAHDALTVADGGSIALHATEVDINADLTARSGSITLGDMAEQHMGLGGGRWLATPIAVPPPAGYEARTTISEGVTLDARGVWNNLQRDASDTSGIPHIHGGSVTIRSSGDLVFSEGALIDVSSGATLIGDDTLRGGRGGDVVLAASDYNHGDGTLVLDGEVRSHGVNGGGTLRVATGGALSIGGELLELGDRLSDGERAPIRLVLTEELVIEAGGALPVNSVYERLREAIAPGEIVAGTLTMPGVLPEPIVTLQPWRVPSTTANAVTVTYIDPATGATRTALGRQNGTVPQGATITRITGNVTAGFVLPTDAFSAPLPVTPKIESYTVAAGQPAPERTVLAPGTFLPAGTTLEATPGGSIGVTAPMVIDTSLFSSGFSNYALTGAGGVAIVDGAQLAVTMPVLRFDPAKGRNVATGADPSAALEQWLPPLGIENPAESRLTQRGGASLELNAGSPYAFGSLYTGAGSRVEVDPGQSLEMYSNDQVILEGELHARGGRVAVLEGAPPVGVAGSTAERTAGIPNARSLWLGEKAVIDVSGLALTSADPRGHRYGQVLDGGRIELGTRSGGDHGTTGTTFEGFLIMRPGARLEASGASALLDVGGQGAVQVASAGGVIALGSTRSLFLDGELRAEAGGAGAAGGVLALRLETPGYGPVDRFTALGLAVDDAVRVPRELVLGMQQQASGLAADIDVAQMDNTLVYGAAQLGVDRIETGGFGSLALNVNGIIGFDGDVALHMDQRLSLTASVLAIAGDGAEDSQVTLYAPYVRLAGKNATQADNTILPNPYTTSNNHGAGNLGVPLIGVDSRLEVRGALIDVTGDLALGARGSIVHNSGTPLVVERLAFDDVLLASSGDLRFVGAGAALSSPGDLTLQAAQIYPTQHGSATVLAGLTSYTNASNRVSFELDPARRLTIRGTGEVPAALPYSVFGRLSLNAANVDQGGVIRAPLGDIQLGSGGPPGITAQQVNLLPGSVTSVSAAGLVMPYGSTVDSLSYTYDGQDVVYEGVGNEPTVTLLGEQVHVQEGALIDLSGGGELTGAGFLTGRGGSTDARLYPLVQTSGSGFILPGLETNPVYAIVPGVQPHAAPMVAENGAGDPVLGRQISSGEGVPGLPAGTYTLLPSTFALLPGAFRVELNGLATSTAAFGGTSAMRNGSWSTAGRLGLAGTGVADALTTQVILTPADTLRSYSQYNETSYAQFALAQAQRDGIARAVLERDAKHLQLSLLPPEAGPDTTAAPALRIEGSVLNAAGEHGRGSVVSVQAGSSSAYDIEILADGASPTAGFDGISIHANQLNAINAARIIIGGRAIATYLDRDGSTQSANQVSLGSNARKIILRSGSELEAAEVFLLSGRLDGGVTVELGASIDTLGRGAAAWDSSEGFIFKPGGTALVVSNGWLDMMAPELPDARSGTGSAAINIGVCDLGAACTGETRLYSEGTLTAATDQAFNLGDSVRFGTRNLVLAMGGINAGGAAALADAGAAGVLPAGLTLNQQVLDRLLQGDTSIGAPALENLVLTARDSVNFYGTVDLSTIDPATGESALERLVLSAPAIYGHGGAGDVARIETDTLVWTGAFTPAGEVITGGAGTGSGQFVVDARRIEFGYGPNSQPDTLETHDRLTLGFADVSLNASERITANHKGALSVYQSRGAWDDATKAHTYSGGNLHLVTPLLTGEAGSVNALRAGGDIHVAAPAGSASPLADNAMLADALGAELALEAGGKLVVDSAMLLPSGKLTLTAEDDVILAEGAQLDLAGRQIDFYDASRYSWGGDVILDSRAGNISQHSASRIDLSAEYNRAGKLTAMALDGAVDLTGVIAGSSSGHYDAGGTQVPFAAGHVDVRGLHITDFAGLNERLTDGGVVGGRSFQLKQGDLTIGDELKAREINVSVDNGSLTVTGTIDASGEQAGTIRLAANDGVTLAGTAVLDTRASVLRKDSYGAAIEAPNRAVIEIDSGDGQLVLANGVRMDLGVAGAAADYGTVTLNAPRLGGATGNDVNIDASGNVQITGAKAITVNAFHVYDDAEAGTDVTADGRSYQVIDQSYLDAKHADSVAFITNALANGTLMDGKLAGLRAYADQFHLRPGVEIISAASNADGDLHVDGDIDLSGHRYASINPHTGQTGVYGSGEAGALMLRAEGDLEIFGSISDGFDGAKLGASPDDNSWKLSTDLVLWGGDVVVPHGGMVTLAAGTIMRTGRVLNYDLPIQAPTLPANTLLPVEVTLTQAFILPAGEVLGGAIFDDAGNLLHAAGSVLAEAVTLPAGARLGAGLRLSGAASVAALTWPKGVPLPYSSPTQGDFVTLSEDITLAKGAVIPSHTKVLLPGGATSVDLRPTDADGTQGRLWALAPMLPEGSQSWDLRLVAGADMEAADRRALTVRKTGDIRLADTHYGPALVMAEIPGTGSPPWLWADDVDATLIDNTLGFIPGWVNVVPGGPISAVVVEALRSNWIISDSPLELNAWGMGPVAVKGEDGPPPDMAWEARPGAREVLFSVLRTGAGDMELLSSGDFQMDSLYGVYTAGTQSPSLGTAYNLPRGLLEDGTVLGERYEQGFGDLVNGGPDSTYQAWYPEAGGNLLLRAGGDVTGNTVGGQSTSNVLSWGFNRDARNSAATGNWLWRQGSGSVLADTDSVPTAWWINFGTYVGGTQSTREYAGMPYLIGFTGVGTLGGGNLTVEVGGDAGLLRRLDDFRGATFNRSQGLNLVVGGTGRVTADGTLVQTGGGDLDLRLGGGFNPIQAANSAPTSSVHNRDANVDYRLDKPSNLPGTLVNLRGALNIAAGQVGTIELRYDRTDPEDSRTANPWQATSSIASGGPVLVLGDAGARIDTRGDLVLAGVGDATRLTQLHNGSPFSHGGETYSGQGYSWFSLWTPATAVDLLSAGGHLTPALGWPGAPSDAAATDGRFIYPSILRAAAANGSLYYGNASLGTSNSSTGVIQSVTGVIVAPSPVAEHFTSTGQNELELLAAESIYAAGYAITRSGADPTALPNPFDPGFLGMTHTEWWGRAPVTNVSLDALAPSVLLYTRDTVGSGGQVYPLFSFTSPTLSAYPVTGQPPALYYAVEGDIVGLRTGSMMYRGQGGSNGMAGSLPTWYEGGGTVAIRAGRDIVNAGTALGEFERLSPSTAGWLGWTANEVFDSTAPRPQNVSGGSQRGNLIAHRNADDISVIEAGRDIRYSSFYIVGPGLMEVSAGRDIYMADKAELKSLGPVVNVTPGDRSSGAGIAVMAGLGDGAQWQAFAERYLDPARQADLDRPFADQPGTALYVYDGELTLAQWLRREFGYGGDEAGAEAFLAQQQAALDSAREAALAQGLTTTNRALAREYRLQSQLHLVNWLSGRFGGRNSLGLHFDAASMDARTFFDTLPPEQQRAYLRGVYYAELTAGGREFNDPDGDRSGSYLRGREAIATLFPEHDADGNALHYQGDVTQFSSPLYITRNISGQTTKRPLPGVDYLSHEEWVARGQSGYEAYYQVLDAGIHTNFGGDISILAPGGQILVGIDGAFSPGPGSGLLTQGEGDISLYSAGSILLGQSRIFTTFGGNILGWSAQGDINAGRGSKTTVVYAPQRRSYDSIGNVALSPTSPNTGAGIATLNPIPEVPPGDIDLIAPEGTIDAGEAGIRVSGNVNVAALHVVNADNIQVQGESQGIPMVAAVNVGALTSASSASSAATQAAEALNRRPANQPSVITVEILGFGEEQVERGAPQVPLRSSAVEVLGPQPLNDEQLARLTDAERRRLAEL